MSHIESQADLGYKFSPDGQPPQNWASCKMYVNEFILGDYTNLAILNDTKVVYINHSVLNIIMTKDVNFTGYTYTHFQNIIRKSTLISGTGEKERNKFFNTMREMNEHRKNAVSNSYHAS